MTENVQKPTPIKPKKPRLLAVEYDGDTYTVAEAEDWEIDALEKAEAGQIVGATKLILGDEQWAKFRETHSRVGQIKDLYDQIGKVAGNS